MTRPWTVSESASLLAIWGLLPRLQPACLLLAETPEDVSRSTTLSIPLPEDTPGSIVRAVIRYAEEHCVEAEVSFKPGRLVINLHRVARGDSE